MSITVTVHFEDGYTIKFTGQNPNYAYWKIGHKFGRSSGCFNYSLAGSYNGAFEVAEKSEDGTDVWLVYEPNKTPDP